MSIYLLKKYKSSGTGTVKLRGEKHKAEALALKRGRPMALPPPVELHRRVANVVRPAFYQQLSAPVVAKADDHR